MDTKSQNTLERRGAALIIAIVLLAVLGIVAGTVLPQLLRDRRELRWELVREQSVRLHDDALRNAEAKRKADPAFSGETFALGSEHQPFAGTFQITTRFENDLFTAEVEYADEQGRRIRFSGR